jgi:hypothetical protein
VTVTARHVYAALICALLAAFVPCTASAQTRIVQDGWEGFATPAEGDVAAHCVLYNRTIDAINRDPYDMIGLSKDATGKLSMLVFLQPNSLVRGPRVPVTVKLDQLSLYLAGDAVSDFHLMIPGPFDGRALSVMREAHTIEISVQRHNHRYDVGALGAILDKLDACAKQPPRPEPQQDP